MTIETLLYFKCCLKIPNDNPKKWTFKPLKRCFNSECLAKDKCQILIEQDLNRISVACKRIHGKFKLTKSSTRANDYDYNYSEKMTNGGWIGNRMVKYDFCGLEPRQALEIMSNGDCGEH